MGLGLSKKSKVFWLIVTISLIIGYFLGWHIADFFYTASNPQNRLVKMTVTSMEHEDSFSSWWENSGESYEKFNITKELFFEFPFKDGIKNGESVVVRDVQYNEIRVGDIVISIAENGNSRIHRVIRKFSEDGHNYITAKGDANPIVLPFEEQISEDLLIGKVIKKAPLIAKVLT